MAETDSILDNQEVTAQTLNDIAIDLGHTSFNGFGEDKFGADELNGITSALVSSGILSSDNKCEPYISDGKMYINTGTIVFASGTKKKITELVELDLITNSYIYALNDTAHNVCKIVVSEEAPADGDFVNLCEIAADGTLTDKRVIAKAKVELPTEGNSYRFSHKIPLDEGVEEFNGVTFEAAIEGVSEILIVSNDCFFKYNVEKQTFSGRVRKEIPNTSIEWQSNVSVVTLLLRSGSSSVRIELSVVSQNDSCVQFEYKTTYYNYSGGSMTFNYYIFGGIEK